MEQASTTSPYRSPLPGRQPSAASTGTMASPPLLSLRSSLFSNLLHYSQEPPPTILLVSHIWLRSTRHSPITRTHIHTFCAHPLVLLPYALSNSLNTSATSWRRHLEESLATPEPCCRPFHQVKEIKLMSSVISSTLCLALRQAYPQASAPKSLTSTNSTWYIVMV